jgi:hypothetical protein
MRPSKIGSALYALFALAAASAVVAEQPPARHPVPDLTESTFRLRITNASKVTIYYKIVGGRGHSYNHQTLQPGKSEIESPVTGGDKVLCVWDEQNRLRMTCEVVIDKSGTIRISNADIGVPDAGLGGGDVQFKGAIPAAAKEIDSDK